MSPGALPSVAGIGHARGSRGAVASGHPLASAAAIDVLRDGGNAVDAAVAAAVVLTVTCPYATSLGGDVTMLIFDAGRGRVLGLNGTGCAPKAAGREAFPDGIPRAGMSTVTVPGFVAGVVAALNRCGTRSLASLMQPATAYARQGVPVHPVLARNVGMKAALLRDDTAAAAIFLPDGRLPAVDDVLVQTDLAASLEAIAAGGAQAFYEGALAAQIVDASQARDGLLESSDLAAHQSLWQEPLSAPFHGREVVVMPPNSYGLTLLLQLIALEDGGIAMVDPDSAVFVQRGLAARRLSYSEAAGAIADPEKTEGSARMLLERVLTGRGTPVRATPELVDGGTTGVAVMDRDGNAVSLLQSVSAPFGAGVVVDGTGIVLNNRMRGFMVDPESANCVAPRRRPAHTLSPSMVLAQGWPVLSIGTPGAVGQTSTLAQVLARSLACGQDVMRAIAAPRWSVDFDGGPIVEAAMGDAVQAALAKDEPAPQVKPTGWQSFGSIKAVMTEGNEFVALADSRRVASAAAC